ncbi:MAG: endonuclease domain-containing protein [Anaerolineae bacterium]|nr:endonuclease domain-containing protein [Anaerolineae bacterium]MCI0609439.1 endonuclease domain-containing protein [Anaerolineae bacterium]
MPAKRTTPKGYKRARELRKVPTPAEIKLWAHLRGGKLNGIKFRRQHAIGEYVPDFCAIKPKLIIELDGSQHLEQGEYDNERTAFFKSKGYRVLRFWNNDVLNNIDAVLEVIGNTLNE